MKIRQLYRPPLLYVVLSLLILLPLLRPGFVLTVDLVFTPKLPMPTSVTSSYLFHASLHLLNYVVPGQILEKLTLFAALFLSGYGMYRCFEVLRPHGHDKEWLLPTLFAGTFYMINPFVYSRFMAGQYSFLLGYALTPFFIASIWNLLTKPGRRYAIETALWALLIGIVSIHTVGLIAVVAVLLACSSAWQHRRDRAWCLEALKWCGGALLLTIIGSSYWLLPLLLGHGTTAGALSDFTVADQQAFRTVPGSFGLGGTVLAMQGFWADSTNLYLTPQNVFAWWWIPIIVLWITIALGLVWGWRRQRDLMITVAATGCVGFILSVGGAGTIFAALNRWLYIHIPFFSGYRESQKFSALLLFAYAYIGGVGLYWLVERLRYMRLRSYTVLWLLLPLLSAPLLLWGGAGQLHAQEYPAGWTQTSQLLTRLDKNKENVVFLPWHLYMPLTFSSGIVANPAPEFFTVPIISSQDPEIGGAHGYYATADARIFADHIEPSLTGTGELGNELAQIHVGYIIVARVADYAQYGYLQHRPAIRLINSNSSFMVYKVNGV